MRLICFTSQEYNYSDESVIISRKVQEILDKNNIEYINYITNPLPELLNKSHLWKDAMHLNRKGAEIESGDIAKRIKK